MTIDIALFVWNSRLALQTTETIQVLPPLLGGTSLVEASAKHPKGGGPMSREERLRRKREWMKRWRISHPEAAKVRNAKYRSENLERIQAVHRRRYRNNREKILLYCKGHYRKNIERIKAYNHALGQKLKIEQPLRVKAWKRRTRLKRKEKDREYQRRPDVVAKHRILSKLYNLKHPEKRKQMNEDWKRRNPEKVRLYSRLSSRRRRSDKANRKLIRKYFESIQNRGFFFCYYCDAKFPSSQLRLDHVHPVSKGGPCVISNICAACDPCNSTKHARLIQDWKKPGQQILAL